MRESSSVTTGKSSSKRFTNAGTSATVSGPSIATPTTSSPLARCAVVHRAQVRELGLAGLAERRPEIEQDDVLAQVIAQPERLAVDVAPREVGREGTRRGGSARARAAVGGRRERPRCHRTRGARRDRDARRPDRWARITGTAARGRNRVARLRRHCRERDLRCSRCPTSPRSSRGSPSCGDRGRRSRGWPRR